ncbi:MAG: transposase [Planctomycetota bacterium]
MAEDKNKARQKRGWIVFQDESGVSQRPPLRRTWAPKGKTPVIVHAFNWSKLSVSGVLAYRWDGKRSRLYFQVTPDSYDTPKLIEFLKELKRHFRGQFVYLVWDGLPAHKSREMKEFLHEQRDWLAMEQLPGYCPDLNPVE